MKIPNTNHQLIITDYQNLTPMKTIARRYGTTRQTVFRVLKSYNIDTSKRKIPTTCLVCGNIITRPKCRIRNATNTFCSNDCFIAYLTATKEQYKENRQGQRNAREIVSYFFNLQPHHVVHHINGNCSFNHPSNLMAFNSTNDHARYHHFIRASKMGAKTNTPPIPVWTWDKR